MATNKKAVSTKQSKAEHAESKRLTAFERAERADYARAAKAAAKGKPAHKTREVVKVPNLSLKVRDLPALEKIAHDLGFTRSRSRGAGERGSVSAMLEAIADGRAIVTRVDQ